MMHTSEDRIHAEFKRAVRDKKDHLISAFLLPGAADLSLNETAATVRGAESAHNAGLVVGHACVTKCMCH